MVIRECGDSKRFVFVFLMLVLFSITFASAADVAYIYRRSNQIDDNFLDVFSDLGLDVDLIDETNLPSSFDNYKMIFVGDERFRKEGQIPVSEIPTVIANYYHGDEWGITDRDGVSKLAANSPLSVKKDGKIIQVYTDALYKLGGIAIPYYYLDDHNKAPGMETISRTYTGGVEYNFGDVVSYADRGVDLKNGKTTQGKVCFYGIIETDYWTPAAREMFKDCVEYVVIDCNDASDCGEDDYVDDKFCGTDGNVYQKYKEYECERPGTVLSSCESDSRDRLQEECDYGCADGECIRCDEDLDCDDGEDYTYDSCEKPGTQQSSCEHEDIECFEGDGRCGGQIVTEECSVLDFLTTTQDPICRNSGTVLSYCDFDITLDVDECNYICSNSLGCDYTECSDSEDNDLDNFIDFPDDIGCVDYYDDDESNVCTQDSQCGEDGWLEEEQCKNNDVYDNFLEFTCKNPLSQDSYCSDKTKSMKKEECGDDYCADFGDDYCDEGNVYRMRTCYDKGCAEGECFSSGSEDEELVDDCGEESESERYCEGNNVVINHTTPTCGEGECGSEVVTEIVQYCTGNCYDGACVDCSEDYYGDMYCDDDDVYYDLHDVFFDDGECRESLFSEKFEECGEEEYGEWSEDYCGLDGDVYHSRYYTNRGCSSGSCFEGTVVQEDPVRECDVGCVDGACVNCTQDSQCSYLDENSCDEDSVVEKEGVCVDYECETEIIDTTDCNDGLFCNGGESCEAGACVGGDVVDCSGSNLLEIATCDNSPDNNLLTWDSALSFTSTCNEASDSCTTGSQIVDSVCDVGVCGAECVGDSDCGDTNCGEDGCVGDDYYDYNDVENDCSGCLCEENSCEAPDISYNDERCVVCTYPDDPSCDYLDETICDGDSVVEKAGVCVDYECVQQIMFEEDCNVNDGWYDSGSFNWIDFGQCSEEEQKEQEEKDYVCDSGSLSCEYSVIGTQWTDTGNNQNKPDGTSCDDGLFCNIDDMCVYGDCIGSSRDCSDSVSCTQDSCDEDSDSCEHSPNNGLCSDGLFCNGEEVCNALSGCEAGSTVDCSDGLFCTVNEECDEGSDSCVSAPRDCSVYNLFGIATCDNNPDANPFTWDFRAEFNSFCDEGLNICTESDEEISHECDISECDAECESELDCLDDYCDIDGKTRYYNSECNDNDCVCEYDSEICEHGCVNGECEECEDQPVIPVDKTKLSTWHAGDSACVYDVRSGNYVLSRGGITSDDVAGAHDCDSFVYLDLGIETPTTTHTAQWLSGDGACKYTCPTNYALAYVVNEAPSGSSDCNGYTCRYIGEGGDIYSDTAEWLVGDGACKYECPSGYGLQVFTDDAPAGSWDCDYFTCQEVVLSECV